MAKSSSTAPVEKTFTSYTNDQGAEYAKSRPGYHPDVYQIIIDHHTSTGGKLDTVLDVGCGPGRATSDLAKTFTSTIGIDPSGGMINIARELKVTSVAGEPVRFEVCTAEELGSRLSPPIENASVDLITAATAAHWFNMSSFWPRAAEVLKPGGTVAFWCVGESKLHPSMPRAALIQAEIEQLWDREVKPFTEPGNILRRGLYVDLELPWSLSSPVAEFDKATFFRKEWGPETSEEFFKGGFGSQSTINLDMLEKITSTMSPVQRWREAHPDAVGTDRDFVKMQRSIFERHLHQSGVENGKEALKGSVTGVLLMVKKKA